MSLRPGAHQLFFMRSVPAVRQRYINASRMRNRLSENNVFKPSARVLSYPVSVRPASNLFTPLGHSAGDTRTGAARYGGDARPAALRQRGTSMTRPATSLGHSGRASHRIRRDLAFHGRGRTARRTGSPDAPVPPEREGGAQTSDGWSAAGVRRTPHRAGGAGYSLDVELLKNGHFRISVMFLLSAISRHRTTSLGVSIVDTLIFSGLLLSLFSIVTRKSRGLILLLWTVMLIATLLLLAAHISSSLGLGLTY